MESTDPFLGKTRKVFILLGISLDFDVVGREGWGVWGILRDAAVKFCGVV